MTETGRLFTHGIYHSGARLDRFPQRVLTQTKGNGVMYHVFHGYAPYKGEIPMRTRGALVAFEAGNDGYGLNNVEERGTLFLGSNEAVYEGMIVDALAKTTWMSIRARRSMLIQYAASGSDEAIRLTPPRRATLEESLEWINEDETVEVTPLAICLRKRILAKQARYKAMKNKK